MICRFCKEELSPNPHRPPTADWHERCLIAETRRLQALVRERTARLRGTLQRMR